ncbi:MAG: hypothetical protein NTW12_01220 [Deltaproteobacteria bacterium]|nr:hypothetical protein [Deltaproteobacteria bacterium]
MADKGITKHQIVQELAELRWRINKLQDWTRQMFGTEEEFLNQSQTSQFFLGLGLSQVVKTEDESTIEKNIHRRWGYKQIKGGL